MSETRHIGNQGGMRRGSEMEELLRGVARKTCEAIFSTLYRSKESADEIAERVLRESGLLRLLRAGQWAANADTLQEHMQAETEWDAALAELKERTSNE